MADEMYSAYLDPSCPLHVDNEEPDKSLFLHIIQQVRNYNINMYMSSIYTTHFPRSENLIRHSLCNSIELMLNKLNIIRLLAGMFIIFNLLIECS